MARPKKTPKVKRSPTAKKRPTTGPVDPSAGRERPLVWRLAQMDFDGEWGWENLAAGDVAALHGLLVSYEQEPMRLLRLQQKVKDIPVEQITQKARDRLKELEREDLEELTELRLPTTDGWRAWGIVIESVFNMLWWDPDHTVCKGLPKGIARKR